MDYERMMEAAVNSMMNVIRSDIDLYTWFVNYTPSDSTGYMFDRHPNVARISTLVNSDGHSGASFGTCMRICKQRLRQAQLLKQ